MEVKCVTIIENKGGKFIWWINWFRILALREYADFIFTCMAPQNCRRFQSKFAQRVISPTIYIWGSKRGRERTRVVYVSPSRNTRQCRNTGMCETTKTERFRIGRAEIPTRNNIFLWERKIWRGRNRRAGSSGPWKTARLTRANSGQTCADPPIVCLNYLRILDMVQQSFLSEKVLLITFIRLLIALVTYNSNKF